MEALPVLQGKEFCRPGSKRFRHLSAHAGGFFIGSDASWDSFEPGKGFHNIGQMCDSVRVIWHDKDIPVRVSKTANFRKRMGLYGPMESENSPPYVTSHYIGDMLNMGDKSGGYHDYLLSNPEFQKMLLDSLKVQDE